MKYDGHFSLEECTLILLVSLYRAENTKNFNPIYLGYLIRKINQNDPKLAQKFTEKLGVFDKPMEDYMKKLVAVHYVEPEKHQNYKITMIDGQAEVIAKNFLKKFPQFYQIVSSLKLSIDNLDRTYLKDELFKDYSVIMTPEDFLTVFFAKLLSKDIAYFDDSIFKDTFQISLFDDENMALFLKKTFSHPFKKEAMLPLVSRTVGLEEKDIRDRFWLGATPQSIKMNAMLNEKENTIMDELVTRYSNKKKTIQNNPSVVK